MARSEWAIEKLGCQLEKNLFELCNLWCWQSYVYHFLLILNVGTLCFNKRHGTKSHSSMTSHHLLLSRILFLSSSVWYCTKPAQARGGGRVKNIIFLSFKFKNNQLRDVKCGEDLTECTEHVFIWCLHVQISPRYHCVCYLDI